MYIFNMIGGVEENEYSHIDIVSHRGTHHNQWLPGIEYGSARSGR
jgi:hypothetical protein